MYFFRLYYQNAKLNKNGQFQVKSKNGSIPKWTIFSAERKTLELFRLIALSTVSPQCIPKLDFPFERLFHRAFTPLHLEFEIFHHPESEGKSSHQHLIVGSGLDIFPDGTIRRLAQRECDYLSASGIYRKIRYSQNPAKHFLLAYSARFQIHDGTDDFDFTHSCFPLARFYTLFDFYQKLTDPVAFLERIHRRGVKFKRFASHSILKTLSDLFETHLNSDANVFLGPLCDLKPTWQRQSRRQLRIMLALIDICRHLYDAFPKSKNPLKMPGVLIFHRPDCAGIGKGLSAWIRLLDSLLPNMQFFISLSEKSKQSFPAAVTKQRLELQDSSSGVQARRASPCLPKRPILLIQVDGRLPNLALMKLSRYYKEKGKNVVLVRGRTFIKRVDEVFASCIYNSRASMEHMRALRSYYGDDIKAGGSGVDLMLRLPQEIEDLPADYELYPELADRAIGFLTRGCPHKCPFCVVPTKEGDVRKVSDFSSLLGKRRKKLILLDDNLMAHEASEEMLEKMASLGLQVNFTQTLDFRHINKKKALLLRAIDCMNTRFTRPNYYFSLNNNKRLSLISSKYKLFGFNGRDNVEFICMYGYDTTLAQDVERFRFLRSLPGAYVFTQQYQPIGADAPNDDGIDFFDDDMDLLIDELISIVFTQNMKSMEKYYRWLSKKYAIAYGRLHTGLVDTIFKYNNRHMRGAYIATLAGTRKR